MRSAQASFFKSNLFQQTDCWINSDLSFKVPQHSDLIAQTRYKTRIRVSSETLSSSFAVLCFLSLVVTHYEPDFMGCPLTLLNPVTASCQGRRTLCLQVQNAQGLRYKYLASQPHFICKVLHAALFYASFWMCQGKHQRDYRKVDEELRHETLLQIQYQL